ncbi:MAG TPA: serine/threonine-protein kinase, partial [Planctomycetota bacterium]|nr:serine/threonine-protein kinase [Planctomycetota bacterium]
MTRPAATTNATYLQDCTATVANGQEVDQTIAAELALTRRIAQRSLADEIRGLGYDLGAELGRGGLGIVCVATQRVFARPVAVKRLLDVTNDSDASLKFYAEALVTAQLEHPHIVPIHDLLADANGQLQLVMKRVDGFSWRDLLHPRSEAHQERARALGLDDHLDILLKVCDGVSFAHGRGILHRDLKPENVMVGAYGEVLVMDWGCAVAFGDQPHHALVPRVEAVRHVSGTPTFMAPEMVLIQAERTGPPSDVYQLGAVLYDVLTRQKPHRGTTIYDVLRDAVEGVVVHPNQAASERAAPAELSEICLAALAKDPTQRIVIVAQFSQRLKEYCRHAQAVFLEHVARQHLAAAR